MDEGAKVQTIFSDASQTIDSRFGKAEEFVQKAEKLTGIRPMRTIAEAEPIGPKAVSYTHLQADSRGDGTWSGEGGEGRDRT